VITCYTIKNSHVTLKAIYYVDFYEPDIVGIKVFVSLIVIVTYTTVTGEFIIQLLILICPGWR
jgi:hypothetical protein